MTSLREERERAEVEQRRLRLRLGVAALAIVIGVAGFGLLAGGRPVQPGQAAYNAGTADPVQAAVPVLSGFVEQARGLRFRSRPVVTVVDPAAFARIVAEPLPGAGGGLNRLATARALGLAHPVAHAGDGPVSGPAAGPAEPFPPTAPYSPTAPNPPTAPVAPSAGVEAFYSYPRHQVVLRSDMAFDAFGRVVLAHELAHALADQHFDLLALTRGVASDADRLRALVALIEGDATRIELAYLGTQSAADQAAVRRRYNYDPRPARYADFARFFPYTLGRDFVMALVAQGGNGAVDAAFRRPPASTAQVIDPRKYLAGVQPLGVLPPAAEGGRVDEGTLGQFGLAMLMTGGRRLLNVSAASQWLGDSYVTFRSGQGFCTHDNVVLATPAAREQLFGDLGAIARNPANRIRVTKSADRGVRIEACR